MSLESSFKIPRNDTLVGLTWINQLISRLMGGANDTAVAPGDSHLFMRHSQRTRNLCELRVYLRGACCILDFFSIFFLHYSSNCISFSFHSICNGLNVCTPSKLIYWSPIPQCDCEKINDCFLSHLVCAIFFNGSLNCQRQHVICCLLKQVMLF